MNHEYLQLQLCRYDFQGNEYENINQVLRAITKPTGLLKVGCAFVQSLVTLKQDLHYYSNNITMT